MKNHKPIHYYSVMTGNRGDVAIRQSIVKAIKKRINTPIAYFNLKYEELTEERILKQLNPHASALIIAGSGLYSNYPKSSGWYFPCDTKLFDKIQKPIILLGIGNNKNLHGNFLSEDLKPEVKNSIKKINNLSSISTVRDTRTYNLLYDIGVNKHQLHLDPANFLERQPAVKEKRIAINLAQHAPILGRFDADKKGKINRQKNIKTFVNLLSWVFKEGYSVIFITHDALEQSLALDLKQQLPNLEILNTDNINKMLYEYARCQFSIGTKMHSNILSVASGTPFISLYYDIKHLEYMRMVEKFKGPRLYGFNIFEDYSSNLHTATELMMKSWPQKSFKLNSMLKREQLRFDKLMDNVCNIL